MNTPQVIYCDESTHLEHDHMPYMVLGAIKCPKSATKRVLKRIRDIRIKHNISPDFEVKWAKVSPAKQDFYLDLVNLFFEEDALSFRAVVAQKDGLKHSAFLQTHDDWYYKMTFYLLRNVLSPDEENYVYLDKKDTCSHNKLEKLHDVVASAQYDFNRDIIKRIQIIDSKEVRLLQLADLLIGAINYENRNNSESGAKSLLVKYIKNKTGFSLRCSTLLSEKKFNIFRWEPRQC